MSFDMLVSSDTFVSLHLYNVSSSDMSVSPVSSVTTPQCVHFAALMMSSQETNCVHKVSRLSGLVTVSHLLIPFHVSLPHHTLCAGH